MGMADGPPGAAQARPVGLHAQTVSHWAQGPGLSLIVLTFLINWILLTSQPEM